MKRKSTITSQTYTYTVVFEPDEDGGYVVTVPALPGCVTHGETLAEARAMASDAIQGYLESLRKHGEPIPTGEENPAKAKREPVTVKIPAE